MVRDAPFYSQITRITYTNHTSRMVYSHFQDSETEGYSSKHPLAIVFQVQNLDLSG